MIAQVESGSFECHYEPEPNSGCFLWTSQYRNGYPSVCVKRNGRWKSETASRVSYEINTGVHPGEMCVLHKCDNPPCVNPDHLFLGTHWDNCEDKARKGRGNKSRSGFPRGVCLLKQTGRYMAQCKYKTTHHYLGVFNTVEEASLVAEEFWHKVREEGNIAYH